MVDWDVIRVFVIQDIEMLKKHYQIERYLLPDIFKIMGRMYFHHLKKYKPRSILNIKLEKKLDSKDG